jgi:hypothetical protein
MDTQKTMGEDPALEIGANLSLDEPCDGRALPSRASQEGLELLADDFVKKRLFGFVAFVSDDGKASIGTLRATTLPNTASDVPRPQRRDDSDAAGRPRAQARCFSVASNDVRIEPAGSRDRRNRPDSSALRIAASSQSESWPTHCVHAEPC